MKIIKKFSKPSKDVNAIKANFYYENKKMLNRILNISKKEKISIKKSDIEKIYSEKNGDIRAMLKELELF